MLSGIKLNLSAMRGNVIIQEKDAGTFTRSIDQLDSAINEMRRVAHNMMPEALLKFGLNEAIQDYCDGINQAGTVKMIFTYLGNHAVLDQTFQVVLYRIVQELTNNAIKHAKAKHIIIQLEKQEHGLSLTIEDDGIGYETSLLSESKGTGLKNVISRINYLKGTINIDSEIGKGTTNYIEIPNQ
jgi:two-component system, NarL family, sensor kinase